MRANAGLRLPPSGDMLGPGAWPRIAGRATSSARLTERLALRLGAEQVQLTRSGRAALLVGLRMAAAATGRDVVVLPAYTCFSVPAAAVAAGLRIRLVDVDEAGRIVRSALAGTSLDDVAAIVVCNLFGRAEPIEEVRRLAAEAGAWVVDDAAQAFGATAAGSTGRAVGARSELGVLSFGRGKPLCGLGGGALVLGAGIEAPGSSSGEVRPAPRRAALEAIAWDAVLQPPLFSLLASIPALGIGDTPFEPDIATGPIDGASLVLTDLALDAAAALAEQRGRDAHRLADDLRERTRFEPILAEPGEHGVYPRLAVRAPSDAVRAAALEALTRCGAGASPFYPSALSRLRALSPHLVDVGPMRGAEDLAARLLTLPVHGRLRGTRWDTALDELSRL